MKTMSQTTDTLPQNLALAMEIKKPEQKVSVGRVVLATEWFSGVKVECAAIVTRVNEEMPATKTPETVELMVFPPRQMPRPASNVRHIDQAPAGGIGWYWPPRI